MGVLPHPRANTTRGNCGGLIAINWAVNSDQSVKVKKERTVDGGLTRRAGGTGVGEEIIRVGGSLFIVEAMRSGKSPQDACDLAVERVNATAVRRRVHPAQVAFLALDPKGRTGAACTKGTIRN